VENQDPAKPKLINRPFEQLAFVAVGYWTCIMRRLPI
jgi:hypothetical protein